MRPIATLLATLALTTGTASAQPPDRPPQEAAAPIGVVATADVGGGGLLGGGTQYTSTGLFEGEVALGYELPLGLRPELAFAVGVAPTGHVALRPGIHYAIPEMPFYLRAALDWSTVRGALAWRWLLAGAGVELRVTDVLGGFAEADLGLPFERNVGVGALVRAGVSFRY